MEQILSIHVYKMLKGQYKAVAIGLETENPIQLGEAWDNKKCPTAVRKLMSGMADEQKKSGVSK